MVYSNDMKIAGPDANQPSEDMQGLLLRRRVRAEFAALSHVGNARKNNEDHYFVGQLGRVLETVLSNVPASLLPTRVEETTSRRF